MGVVWKCHYSFPKYYLRKHPKSFMLVWPPIFERKLVLSLPLCLIRFNSWTNYLISICIHEFNILEIRLQNTTRFIVVTIFVLYLYICYLFTVIWSRYICSINSRTFGYFEMRAFKDSSAAWPSKTVRCYISGTYEFTALIIQELTSWQKKRTRQVLEKLEMCSCKPLLHLPWNAPSIVKVLLFQELRTDWKQSKATKNNRWHWIVLDRFAVHFAHFEFPKGWCHEPERRVPMAEYRHFMAGTTVCQAREWRIHNIR